MAAVGSPGSANANPPPAARQGPCRGCRERGPPPEPQSRRQVARSNAAINPLVVVPTGGRRAGRPGLPRRTACGLTFEQERRFAPFGALSTGVWTVSPLLRFDVASCCNTGATDTPMLMAELGSWVGTPQQGRRPVTLDQDSWIGFRARFVSDLGATIAVGNMVVGHRLGLYRVGHGAGVSGAAGGALGTDPRYVAEWLAGRAAGGYVVVTYDALSRNYSITEELAFAMADPDGLKLPAAFLMALGALRVEPRITDAFQHRAGDGLARARPGRLHGHRGVHRATYTANLVPAGCQRWTAWSTDSRPAGGSPTWVADWACRPCSSLRPIRSRRSSAPIITSGRSTWPANMPPPLVFRSLRGIRTPHPATSGP